MKLKSFSVEILKECDPADRTTIPEEVYEQYEVLSEELESLNNPDGEPVNIPFTKKYEVADDSEFKIVGSFNSGKTTACNALQIVKSVVTNKPFINNDNITKIIVMMDNGVSYEVQLNQCKIVNETFSVGETNISSSTGEHTSFLFNSITSHKLSDAIPYHADFIKFFEDTLFLSPKHILNNELNYDEMLNSDILASVTPDLGLVNWDVPPIKIPNTNILDEITFKGKSLNTYSVNTRIILVALIFFKFGSLVVLDDVPTDVIEVIKEHMPKEKELIYTSYK